MDFDNIFELLEAVRTYQLRPKEHLIPFTSATGLVLGYVTADSDFPSIEWTITARAVKRSAQERGTPEAKRIRDLFVSHMGRRQLLQELREGELNYGIAQAPEPVVAETSPGPRQLELPL